jgi:hypothetical protein
MKREFEKRTKPCDLRKDGIRITDILTGYSFTVKQRSDYLNGVFFESNYAPRPGRKFIVESNGSAYARRPVIHIAKVIWRTLLNVRSSFRYGIVVEYCHQENAVDVGKDLQLQNFNNSSKSVASRASILI